MESLTSVVSKRFVRTMNSAYFKSPFSFFHRRKGIQSVGPVYDSRWDWPTKKSGHNVISPKYGTRKQKNRREFRDYTGCQPTGYVDKTGKFIVVPEMIPEIVAPDLTNFELKPYVSFRYTGENETVVDEPFTAKKLFDACYGHSTMIFNLYIFDRNGTCIFYREWKRSRKSRVQASEENKLLYGMLISLKSFSSKLAPFDCKATVRSFTTNQYKMTYFETPTNFKFVMNTDRNAPSVHDLLRQIYAEIYVPYVTKNRLAPLNDEINSEIFASQLNDLVEKHVAFV
uniref:Trafficking protein particle complex subunit n=1 Tax=Romanomermis culicivorax TaxID=13658 RepID=A0A915KHW3_ROMCU